MDRRFEHTAVCLMYRFGGKEIAGQKVGAIASAGSTSAAAGRPYLDFGARLYDPRTAAWISQDPLAEKYYSISPYAYCGGDPVNLVDPEGKDWYRIFNNNEYEYYYDDDVFDKESFSALGIEGEYLGRTYLDNANNIYYSLFGEKIPYYESQGRPYLNSWLYKQIDLN